MYMAAQTTHNKKFLCKVMIMFTSKTSIVVEENFTKKQNWPHYLVKIRGKMKKISYDS